MGTARLPGTRLGQTRPGDLLPAGQAEGQGLLLAYLDGSLCPEPSWCPPALGSAVPGLFPSPAKYAFSPGECVTSAHAAPAVFMGKSHHGGAQQPDLTVVRGKVAARRPTSAFSPVRSVQRDRC